MTQQKDQMVAFNELSEKEVIELSSRAKIDKLQADEIFIKQYDPDPMLFVILDGKMRFVQGPKAHQKTIVHRDLKPANVLPFFQKGTGLTPRPLPRTRCEGHPLLLLNRPVSWLWIRPPLTA